MRIVKEGKWKLKACLRERTGRRKKNIVDVKREANMQRRRKIVTIDRNLIISKRNIKEILLTINFTIVFNNINFS